MSGPLRVLYLTFGNAPGGAEMMLAELLSVLNPEVVDAHVLVSGPGPLLNLVKDHARIIVEPRLRHIVLDASDAGQLLSNGLSYLSVVGSLARRLRRDRFHLVHAAATPAFKYGGIAARTARIPSLATLYEVLDDRLISRQSLRFLSLNLNLFYSQVLVPSKAARDSAIRGGIEAARLSVFENAIKIDRFQPNQDTRITVRAELGISQETIVLGTVGRLIPLKGQDVVIRAVAPLLVERTDVHLVIVGGARTEREMSWERRLRDLTAELGVTNRVTFTGWRTDMDRVYQGLDCLIHAPTLPDSSPVVLIEAMASGVPCIGVDNGGIGELLIHDETGVLIPIADVSRLRAEISSLVDDPRHRLAIAARGRMAVADRFDSRVRARTLEEMYRKLCATASPPARTN